jgi:hypothetical protein
MKVFIVPYLNPRISTAPRSLGTISPPLMRYCIGDFVHRAAFTAGIRCR